jgi:Zn-dependent protease
MWRTYRIGRILGFPIELNLSFLLLLGFVLLWSGGLTGVYVVLLGFASVLLHELGHALVARRLGVRIAGIELRFFGGVAKMIDPPRTAGHEVAIAAAGPAVSFVLAGLALAGSAVSGAAVFELLWWTNLVIAVFNLTPALPMDGGRILRALLSRRLGFERATEIAIQVARGFAILFGLVGLVTGRPYLVMLAVMLWWMGSAERALGMRGYGAAALDDGWRSPADDGWRRPGEPRPFVHTPIRIVVRRF